MNNKPDPLQQAKQRELLEKLLLAYGFRDDLSQLDNAGLKAALEKVISVGIAK